MNALPTSSGEFAEIATRFVRARKECVGRMRWRTSPSHADYAIAPIRLVCPEFPRIKARVVLSAHIYLAPPKYMFVLLFGRTRVAGLDTDPRRSHRNLIIKQNVTSTHWTYYPCDEVISDLRTMSHRQWLDEFFKRCNIVGLKNYALPIHDHEQLRLPL